MVIGVTPEVLGSRFPCLYHMAEAGSWPGIACHGLLSTQALLDLFEIQGARREALLSRHRPECVPITHPVHGTAVIRDQKPMDDNGLMRALRDGLTPRDWYRILNGKVFFWLTLERLQRFMGAKAYRDNRKTVLVVDTLRLLERHSERVLLSPINSGCTKPYPHSRGRDTFLRLADYPFESWNRRRRGNEPVVELAVDYAVPDICNFVVRAEEVGGRRRKVVLV